jgi:predicted aspartyl protease
MKLNKIYSLPFAEAVFVHQGKEKFLSRVLIDTGAAATLLSVEAAIELGLGPQMSDTLRSMRGVGGVEFVYEKKIDMISLDDVQLTECIIQVGAMDYGFEMDAIIGMDILTSGKFILNLGNLELSYDNY